MAETRLTGSPAHGNDGLNTACEYYCVTVRRQATNAFEAEKHQLRISQMRCRVKVAQTETFFGQIGWHTDKRHVVCNAGPPQIHVWQKLGKRSESIESPEPCTGGVT